MNGLWALRLAALVALALVPAPSAARVSGWPVHGTAGRARVELALRHRLDRAYLSYEWVVCVDMNRFYAGKRIWRCNVDFGDPHIVQYCVVLDGHRLITDHENRALDCSPRRPHRAR